MVVRPQPRGRGDRLARRRWRRGRRRRRDELLPHGARRRRDPARDPGERRNGSPLPRAGRVLDARAGERARSGGGRVAADRDLPERRVASDLRDAARLDRPAAAPPVGEAVACGRRRAIPARPARRAWRPARAGHAADRVEPPRGAGRRALRTGLRRARRTRGRGLREPLRPRRGVLQLALPRLAPRLPVFRRLPRRAADGRRGRGPHVQARSLGRVPRRSRGPAGRPGLDTCRAPTLDEVRGGADALILLPPRDPAARRALLTSGFAPTNKKLRFIGKTLHDDAYLVASRDAWHFTLGDFDFF